MTMTIRMYCEEKDKYGDIHADEVENMKRAGWSVVSDEPSKQDAEDEGEFTGTKHVGSGWYEIWVDGVLLDKVRGEQAAEDALAIAKEV